MTTVRTTRLPVVCVMPKTASLAVNVLPLIAPVTATVPTSVEGMMLLALPPLVEVLPKGMMPPRLPVPPPVVVVVGVVPVETMALPSVEGMFVLGAAGGQQHQAQSGEQQQGFRHRVSLWGACHMS